jgi:hypothetical protein
MPGGRAIRGKGFWCVALRSAREASRAFPGEAEATASGRPSDARPRFGQGGAADVGDGPGRDKEHLAEVYVDRVNDLLGGKR